MTRQGPAERPRGFTIVEVMIVIAIIGVLAALLFPVFRSAKASSKQTVTAGKLAQIYKAMLLYGSDYDVFDEVPGFGNVPAMPLLGSYRLFAYGLTPDILHSEAFPRQGWKRWGSSFTTMWIVPEGLDFPNLAQQSERNLQELRLEGSNYTIMCDLIHDYFDYWPSEKDSDPLMQRRFQISLKVNGSIKRERKPGIRGWVLPYWWD